MARQQKSGPKSKSAQAYKHPDSNLPARPEIGAQAHFKQAKPPTRYRFDSSLAPALEWDGQNPSRERAEALIREIAECGLKIADLSKKEASQERDRQIENFRAKIRDGESALRKISGPFLNWSGKAERLSFDVSTLPLFIHERLTCDTSRVPLALARQRLLTATFNYYELNDEKHGPAGGFVYKRKQNQKGEEVGGIVPHITLAVC